MPHSGRHPGRPPGADLRAREYVDLLRRRAATEFLERVAARAPRVGHFRIGREHAYLVSTPDLAHQVLVTEGRHTEKGRGLHRARVLLGEGLLTSEGERHRRARRLVQPAFHAARIERYADQHMGPVAVRHGAAWRDGDRVDLAAEMGGLTLRVVGQALFGADLAGDARVVGDAVSVILRYSPRVTIPFGMLLQRLPLPSSRRVRAAQADLDRVVQRVVAGHRAAPAAGAGESTLLGTLLRARDDDGSALTGTQLRDEVLTLLLAGHETTAMALTWTWYLLDRNPDAAARLHREVDALGGPPAFADLPSLPYTRAVVAESMRLYPPAWTVSRLALRDLLLDGWHVPAGSQLVLSQWVLHRDGRWWDQPARFRPQRWLDASGGYDESAPGQPRHAYLPFGTGRRRCVGEAFAWTEAVLLLATLARDWAPAVVPGHPVTPFPGITLRPAHGLPAVLHRR